MNRKRVLYLIAILILAGICIFVFRKKIFKENNISDFAVKDTASITRIFLADKNGHQCTLDKTPEGRWRVNGKYDVQESKLQTLMDAIYRVRVKSPVPKKERDDVVRILATSIKVMIYKGDELMKVYYVGSETADYLGTYMCIENADEPMITEIPGFNGFLTPRFIVREEDWKSNTIVRVNPENIASVEVSYDNHPEVSFIIQNGAQGHTVSSLDPKVKEVFTNPVKIDEYLKLYSNLSMEGYDNRATNAFNDSLKTSRPFVTITIKQTDGKEIWVKVFYKILPPGSEVLDENGKQTNIDTNRYYAVSSTEDRVMIVQIPNFGRVMQRFDFFR
jgi:hypothetical protein